MGFYKYAHPVDPADPRSKFWRGTVELSRSQVKVFADAIQPVWDAAGKNKTPVAEDFEVSLSTLRDFMARKAVLRVDWTILNTLAQKCGIDISGWDVYKS